MFVVEEASAPGVVLTIIEAVETRGMYVCMYVCRWVGLGGGEQSYKNTCAIKCLAWHCFCCLCFSKVF